MTGKCSAELRKFVLFFTSYKKNENNQTKNFYTTNIFHKFDYKLRTNKAVIKAIKNLYKHK
jgi:hypothetical protein